MEAIMYFKVVYETLTPWCVATFGIHLSTIGIQEKNHRILKKNNIMFSCGTLPLQLPQLHESKKSNGPCT
jgi:hypothetical protein